jgi:hypothetical protein
MARRTVFPPLVFDPLQLRWFAAGSPVASFTKVQAYTLPSQYNIHRMDLYLWSSDNSTPNKAYYGSYFNNALEGSSSSGSFVSSDGTLQPSVTWSVSGGTDTVPCVYYIDINGNVVHTAFGGITGSGSPLAGTGGGGGGGGVLTCKCGWYILPDGTAEYRCIGLCNLEII